MERKDPIYIEVIFRNGDNIGFDILIINNDLKQRISFGKTNNNILRGFIKHTSTHIKSYLTSLNNDDDLNYTIVHDKTTDSISFVSHPKGIEITLNKDNSKLLIEKFVNLLKDQNII